MSEPTFSGDVPACGDWSQVYTNLDWVERWMADHGYTGTEIAYVVDRPLTPAVAAEVAPVEVPGDVSPTPEAVETGEPVWTIPLTFAEPDTASEEDGPSSSDETDDTESTESVPA